VASTPFQPARRHLQTENHHSKRHRLAQVQLIALARDLKTFRLAMIERMAKRTRSMNSAWINEAQVVLPLL
jgi:hypothetical protein